MTRPHVISLAMTSVDGRLDGFPADVGRYYELAASLAHDAVLTGSGTMVAAAADAGIDLAGEDEQADPPSVTADDPRPRLVVVDSRGRLTRFGWLRAAGFWRDILVVGSRATPTVHRDRLRDLGVPFRAVGDDRVDLAAALRQLAENDGIGTVRVDAGPGLNGALLEADLLDEVSVLLAPYLVGSGRGVFDDLAGEARPLELRVVEELPDGHLWLRYAVRRP